MVNARYHIKGELGRRLGVDRQAHTGTGLCFKNMGAPDGGDYIFGVDATSGDLVVGAL